jgi:hypothetical protein
LKQSPVGGVFLKRSGPIFQPYRNETANDMLKGLNSYAIVDVPSMFTQLDQWEPAYKPVVQKKTVPGTTNLQGGKLELRNPT